MGRAFEVRKMKMDKTNAAKSRVYSKYGKLIYKAARSNPNPESNTELLSIIKAAKRAECTKDIIQRALDKASSNEQTDFKNLTYEGFISKNAYIIIETSTENSNRTAAEVKSAFAKSETKIATPGSVSIYFQKLAVVVVKNQTEDQVYEICLENNIEINEVETQEDNIVITAPAPALHILTNNFANDDIIYSEVKLVPNEEVSLTEEENKKYQKLITLLNECNDIDDIYTNITGEE